MHCASCQILLHHLPTVVVFAKIHLSFLTCKMQPDSDSQDSVRRRGDQNEMPLIGSGI